MTAIAAVFGPAGASERVVRAMLARMPQRGAAPGAVVAGEDAVLGVARLDWEHDASVGGPVDVVRHDGLTIAADATLYYRDDLRALLTRAGVAPSGATSSHLALDAYRAWGADCAQHLEGDFAFVVWDERRGTAFCCRDGIGLRPLYYGVFDGTLVIASCAAGVLAHPHATDDLNLRAIGAVVGGQGQSLGAETTYREVRALQAGASLSWHRAKLEGPTTPVAVAPDPAAGRLGFAAAAERLRELLVAAVRERLPDDGTAAVWMSGGWDSTAVFAAGRESLRRAPRAAQLRPVCISYPEGDPGREDDLIQSVLAHWHTDAHWLRSDDIPLLDDMPGAAARRDEAAALLYGPWNAALAQGSRATGARVALDGNGGDQLYGPSTSQLAELLAAGHWYSLAREWWIRRSAGPRRLWRGTVGPLLSSGPHFRDRPMAPWIRKDFSEREQLLEFERGLLPRQGWGVIQRDREWLLTAPYVGWAMSRIAELALGQGVELRSPLLDRRLIAFAFGRPWHDRARRWETKRLLRAAMRDLLPPAVLAPRGRRTGVTTGYSRGWMQRRYPELFAQLLGEPLELERLGIVDGAALRSAVATVFTPTADSWTRINLYQVLAVEHWLRARTAREITTASSHAAVPRDRAEWFALQRSHVFHPIAGG